MFQSYSMQKYMKENKLSFTERYDFNEIFTQFVSIKDHLSYTDKIEQINSLINNLKCWIQHYYKKEGNSYDHYLNTYIQCS